MELSTETRAATRDVITIGCSAGGLEVLGRIVQQLDRDLKASVVIVQHIAPTPNPYLVSILQRESRLPVAWAEQGTALQHGHIYVAPPDSHTLFADRHLALNRGPRENHARPSIDKLFRSAAATHRSSVIGVLLTGMLHDGVAGLRAIHHAGGVTIVQDPGTAAFPELPSRALSELTPGHVLRAEAIGVTLAELAGKPVPTRGIPPLLLLEARLDTAEQADPKVLEALGTQSPIACPDCQGPMWQVHKEPLRFRCYLGHANTAPDVLQQSEQQVESALWSAIRALHDRAITFELLADDATRSNQAASSEVFAQRAREAREQADIARNFMLDLTRRLRPV